MKTRKLSLLSLLTILALSITINIAYASQTLTVPYSAIKVATTTYNVADYNDTHSITLQDALTWNATTTGRLANFTFVSTESSANYWFVEFNATYVIQLVDDKASVLFSDVKKDEYVYIQVYDTYIRLKTDTVTSWSKIAHARFNMSSFDVNGVADSASAGSVKTTVSALAGVGVIDLDMINQIIPIIVTMAVISMVVKMLGKMTEKMAKV